MAGCRARTPLPIPPELAPELSAAVARFGGVDYVITDRAGQPSSTWAIERATRSARPKVTRLPEAFRFYDLRQYLASLLKMGRIASDASFDMSRDCLPVRELGVRPAAVAM